MMNAKTKPAQIPHNLHHSSAKGNSATKSPGGHAAVDGRGGGGRKFYYITQAPQNGGVATAPIETITTNTTKNMRSSHTV